MSVLFGVLVFIILMLLYYIFLQHKKYKIKNELLLSANIYLLQYSYKILKNIDYSSLPDDEQEQIKDRLKELRQSIRNLDKIKDNIKR